MLNIITLDVIRKIFEDVLDNKKTKVSSEAIGAYVSSLIYHFQGKPASIENMGSFYIPATAFKIRLPIKRELIECELIEYRGYDVFFPSVWAKYVVADQFGSNISKKPEPATGVIMNEIEKELKENQSLFEVCSMKHRITLDRFLSSIEIFVAEQVAFDKKYPSKADAKKHYVFWLAHYLARNPLMPTDKTKQTLLGE
jgi:hypothetical protein